MTHLITRYTSEEEVAAALRADVAAGLTADPKWLPPKWFYDARGSELFEQITTLPEYYPTRREWEILEARAGEIALATGADTLVELGSGSSRKTRALLDALRRNGTLRGYVAVDVSESALAGAAQALAPDYPDLELQTVVADFEHHLDVLPALGRRLIAFLGGTVGNLDAEPRAKFLSAVRAGMKPGDSFLLGTDLLKDPPRLVAAYDDAAGVTAEFNRNVLHVINDRLGADFAVDLFDHVVVWNGAEERIEMWLEATVPMTVRIESLDMTVPFARGERLRTETSAKFRPNGVRSELAAAGLTIAGWWTDAAGDYGVSLATPTL